MARGSGNRNQFAPTVGGLLPSDQFHLLDTPSAGPVLLHIPTSRLFAISPALADQIRVPTGVVARVSTSVISKGSREPASGPPEKSRSPALPLPPGEGQGEGVPSSPSLLAERGPGGEVGLSPALADHFRAPSGVISKGSREPASGPPEKSRSASPPSKPGQAPVSLVEPRETGMPVPGLDPDLASALAELQALAAATPKREHPKRSSLSPEEASRQALESVKWGDLTLFITDRCNQQCAYCFESYAPARREGRTISKETAGEALDFFFDRLFPNAEVYDLHLFGGEPLLAWDMVEWVTVEAQKRAERKGKPVYLSISTNAIGLTRRHAEFFRKHEFDVNVSLDGPPEVHDRYRPMLGGGGSYAQVVRGLHHLLEAGRPPYTSVAGRLHRGNTDVLAAFQAAYEVTEGKCGIGFKLARLGPKHPLALRARDMQALLVGYHSLSDHLVARLRASDPGPLLALLNANDYLARFVLRLYVGGAADRRCGAGISRAAVDTAGNLYPCQSCAGYPETAGGSVSQGLAAGSLPCVPLVEQRAPCATCWARHLCGGGCYAHGVIAGQGPSAPDAADCLLMEGIIRLACNVASAHPAILLPVLSHAINTCPEKHRCFAPDPAALRPPMRPRVAGLQIVPEQPRPGRRVWIAVAIAGASAAASVSGYDALGHRFLLRRADQYPVTEELLRLERAWPGGVRLYETSELVPRNMPEGPVSLRIVVQDGPSLTVSATTSVTVAGGGKDE